MSMLHRYMSIRARHLSMLAHRTVSEGFGGLIGLLRLSEIVTMNINIRHRKPRTTPATTAATQPNLTPTALGPAHAAPVAPAKPARRKFRKPPVVERLP